MQPLRKFAAIPAHIQQNDIEQEVSGHGKLSINDKAFLAYYPT